MIWSTNVSWDAKRNPNSCIRTICSFVNRLSDDAKEQWEKAHHKVLNIGIETASSHWAFEQHISSETVSRMHAIGVGIAVTLYPTEMM